MNHEQVSEHEEIGYRRSLCRFGRMLYAGKSCSSGHKRTRRATPANVSTVPTRATGDAVRRGIASRRISRERSAVRIHLPLFRQSQVRRVQILLTLNVVCKGLGGDLCGDLSRTRRRSRRSCDKGTASLIVRQAMCTWSVQPRIIPLRLDFALLTKARLLLMQSAHRFCASLERAFRRHTSDAVDGVSGSKD